MMASIKCPHCHETITMVVAHLEQELDQSFIVVPGESGLRLAPDGTPRRSHRIHLRYFMCPRCHQRISRALLSQQVDTNLKETDR
jgi:hypothetical protein